MKSDNRLAAWMPVLCVSDLPAVGEGERGRPVLCNEVKMVSIFLRWGWEQLRHVSEFFPDKWGDKQGGTGRENDWRAVG